MVDTADDGFFGFTAQSAGDELMGHQNTALSAVFSLPQYGADRVGIGADLLFGEEPLHLRGFDKGQQSDLQRAVFVFDGNGVEPAAVRRGDVDILAAHQAGAEGHALGGVVIAADQPYAVVLGGQREEKVIQQVHGFFRRDGLIVDIAGDEHGVDLLFRRDIGDLFQNVFLIFDHGILMDAFSQMKIGQVHEFHKISSYLFISYYHYMERRAVFQGLVNDENLFYGSKGMCYTEGRTCRDTEAFFYDQSGIFRCRRHIAFFGYRHGAGKREAEPEPAERERDQNLSFHGTAFHGDQTASVGRSDL